MPLAFHFVFVAAGREPSGFEAFIRHSPDGSRRSATKVTFYTNSAFCTVP